jgi:site-specific DNA-methyltransferase (adenine-specific)
MSLEPYWSDGQVSLYLGDCREVLPALGVTADLVLADPPYGEISLAWDRWPDGWLQVAISRTHSLWCFGSLRLFCEQWPAFTNAGWKLSHEVECEWIDHVAWEKHNGSSFAKDRFRKVHEIAAHWYEGPWGSIYHEVPTEKRQARGGPIVRGGTPHLNNHGAGVGELGPTVLMRSVIRVHSMHGRAIHPTEKPTGILDPLIRYACPLGGLVVDPFAGSGSTLDAARCSGRRAIGVEIHEPYAEAAAKRLSQASLFGGAA